MCLIKCNSNRMINLVVEAQRKRRVPLINIFRTKVNMWCKTILRMSNLYVKNMAIKRDLFVLLLGVQ